MRESAALTDARKQVGECALEHVCPLRLRCQLVHARTLQCQREVKWRLHRFHQHMRSSAPISDIWSRRDLQPGTHKKPVPLLVRGQGNLQQALTRQLLRKILLCHLCTQPSMESRYVRARQALACWSVSYTQGINWKTPGARTNGRAAGAPTSCTSEPPSWADAWAGADSCMGATVGACAGTPGIINKFPDARC